MELKLNKIGVIQESTIKFDGLTVITGRNNSGKSTIGKALYSIIAAVEKLEANCTKDKARYAISIMRTSIEMLELFRMMRNYSAHGETELRYMKLFEIINSKTFDFNSVSEIIKYIEDLLIEIDELSDDKFVLMFSSPETKLTSKRIKDRMLQLEEKKPEVRKSLESLIKTLQADPKLVAYANARINKMLDIEFFEQIQPIKGDKGQISNISLSNDNIKSFDIDIRENRIANKGEAYFSSSINKVVLIDDVHLVDKMTPNYAHINIPTNYYPRFGLSNYSDFTDSINCQSHGSNLLEKLVSRQLTVFEEYVNSGNSEKVLNLINDLFPNKVTYIDGKFVYSDERLDVRNLATGSKMFAIIKILLENGHLDSNTALILDEPEAHFHPEWQNTFAEIVVLLVKELKIKVLLTTHSPSFLLALDVLSKKYKLSKNTHFYNAQKKDDGYMVNIKCIDNKINEAYALMSKPFLEMDALRTTYLHSNNKSED